MSDDAFSDRRRALEESFFHQRNQELLDRLRDELAHKDQKMALSVASGITDDAVLEHCLAANIDCHTLLAFAQVPLVAVAWADGKVQTEERDVILGVATELGLAEDQTSFELLRGWLDGEPSADLLESWKGYARALATSMTAEAMAVFRNEILQRATKVAKAAGGVLGMGSISKDEQAVLDQLKQALTSA